MAIFRTNYDGVFAELKQELAFSRFQVTIWGQRLVKVEGRSIELQVVVQRLFEACRERCVQDDLSLSERRNGMGAVRSLRILVEKTDREVRCAGCFTRLLRALAAVYDWLVGNEGVDMSLCRERVAEGGIMEKHLLGISMDRLISAFTFLDSQDGVEFELPNPIEDEAPLFRRCLRRLVVGI